MNATASRFEQEVKTLTTRFPVEDIWLLEAQGEDFLEASQNLIVIVPEDAEPHLLEKEMKATLGADGKSLDIFAFRLSAIERIPRPLMVKMALSRGQNIYRR